MDNSNQAIRQTLAYRDIFDYPLTKEELWKFLITSQKISKETFEKALKKKEGFSKKDRFYFLQGREEIVEKRLKREHISTLKISYAKKVAFFLSLIPSIKFVGISGSLASKNANKNDDIDFFIITSHNSLWVTRLITMLFLKPTGTLRSPKKKQKGDLFCLNMWIEENSLSFSQKRQDMYTAHELALLLPLINKEFAYERLMTSNLWLLSYLPNVSFKKNYAPLSSSYFLIKKINNFAKDLQLFYMKRKRTNEEVRDSFAAFHPFNYKTYILEEWRKRIKQYEI